MKHFKWNVSDEKDFPFDVIVRSTFTSLPLILVDWGKKEKFKSKCSH